MLSTPHLHIHNLDLPPGLHADVKRGLRQGSVSYGLCGVILNDRDVKEFANYLEQHQQRRPPDHLVSEWINAETKQAKVP
jgi:hypothetical protein